MRRHVGLIITLFYLFSTVGIPVVAYSCVEGGETGVVPYLSMSPRSCYADSCCDVDQDPPNLSFESDVPCCGLSVQTAPENGILLPSEKCGQASQLAEAPAPFDAANPDARIAYTLPSVSVVHASINLPLLM